MELFWQDLVNGILAGGIFAVVALGFSLVWGIMNIINLAHGAFVMLGAYTAYVLFTTWHVDPFVSIPIAFVAAVRASATASSASSSTTSCGRRCSRRSC